MTLKSIADFSAHWNQQTQQGVLELQRADGGFYRLTITPQAEFAGVVERISQERPIQFDTETADIFVHHQFVYQATHDPSSATKQPVTAAGRQKIATVSRDSGSHLPILSISIDKERPRMKTTTFAELESAVRSYARAFPRNFERALGAEIWDTSGTRYLDFLAGAGSLNYGHNNPLLKEALIEYIQRDGITHSLDLHTRAKENFLIALRDIILKPRGLDYVVQFTGPTGTNAVEAALKLARKVTGRAGVIFFTNGFHGVSMGALAVTGNHYLRNAAGVALGNSTALPYDGYFGDEVDTIAYLDRLLSDPSSGVALPAAVIVEVVQGEGGLNVARVEWLQALQTLCHKKEILLIVDDIQAGCGRTGTFFSFEAAKITPDIITLSKSLSGYGLPMAVVLIKRALDVWQPGEHNGTFRGNNLAFVTATAALEHYWRTPKFSREVQAKGEHLAQRLEVLVDRFSPDLIDVRGRGMMRGIRCANPQRAAAVTKQAFVQGLIVERAGPEDEVIKCMMPLTIDEARLDEGLDILGQAIFHEYGNTHH